jgi:hypothetical protein
MRELGFFDSGIRDFNSFNRTTVSGSLNLDDSHHPNSTNLTLWSHFGLIRPSARHS